MGNALTSTDCPERWRGQPQGSPLTGRRLAYTVPDGFKQDSLLTVRSEDETIVVPLPAGASSGDALFLMQRRDSSWRVGKKTTSFGFRLPPTSRIGDRLTLQMADGTEEVFQMSEGMQPGSVVYLERAADLSWSVKDISSLPEFDAAPSQTDWVTGQYHCLLALLQEKGFVQQLRSLEGVLRVSVPFCGRLREHASLSNFIATHCLACPGMQEASIYATDFLDSYILDWAIAERWCERVHPNIRLRTRVGDLAQEQLPPADLVIALHPEVSTGGFWFRIIGSVVQSCAGGVCVFGTFYEMEMNTLCNMIDMYKSESAVVEVFDNPHYASHALDSSMPHISFIVVVHTPAPGTACASGSGSG